MKNLKLLFALISIFLTINLSAQIDSIKHEIRIVLENADVQEWTKISAPYINSLRDSASEFTNYFGIEHPSQMNYYVLGAGINYHIGNNNPGYRTKNQSNSYTQLKLVNKTFCTYNQGMPTDGTAVWSTGAFAARHDWTYAFNNIPVTQRKMFTKIPVNLNTLENLVDIVLDLNNDGHDTSPDYVDNFFKTNSQIQKIILFVNNPNNKARLWITTDEGTLGQKVLCFVIGYNVKKNTKISTTYNHYNLFNTNLFNLGAASCNSGIGKPPMTGWRMPVKDTVITPVDTNKVCFKTKIDSTKSISKIDTTYKISSIDTTFKWDTISTQIIVPCDTIIQYPTGIRAMYISRTSTKIGDIQKENMLINYCKQLGVNLLYLYDNQSIINNILGKVKMKAFIQKCQANNIKVGLVGGSSNDFINIKTFALSTNTKIDALIRENEIWSTANGSSVIALNKDTEIALTEKQVSNDLGISIYGNYIGWIKPPTEAAFSEALIKNSTRIDIHYYRTGLDSTYGKTRLKPLLLTEAKRQNKITHFSVILSAEPVFMLNWLKNTPDALNVANKFYAKFFKQFEPWFIYDGLTLFSDEHMLLAIPYKAPNILRNVFPINYADPDFQMRNPNMILDSLDIQ